MKQTGDKPPLKKSTITKAHDIAKSIQKDEEPKADKMNKQQKDAGGEKKVVKEGGISDYLIDLEDDAADMSLQDFLKKHKNGMASLPDLKQIWKRVNESVNEEEEKETEEVKSLRDTIHDVWNQAANEEEKREEDAKWLKTEEKKSITEEKIKCPNCGHMNDADAKKCSNCGHDLTKSEEKDSKKKAMTGSPASKVDTTPEVEFEK